MSDWQDLWVDTEIDPPDIDIGALRRKSEDFEKVIQRRNWIEVGAGIFVIVAFGGFAVFTPDRVEGLGNGLVALAAFFVTFAIVIRGSLGPVQADPTAQTAAYLDAHRAELRHQIRLLRWVPLWYLGPFVPGVLTIAFARYGLGAMSALYIGVFAVFFGGLAWVNRRGAQKFQEQLDGLQNGREGEDS
jgi:hypothetical protein